MGKFIKVGKEKNEKYINKNDIVSVEKERDGFISICYKTCDETGNLPYRIEKISLGARDTEYTKIIAELNED